MLEKLMVIQLSSDLLLCDFDSKLSSIQGTSSLSTLILMIDRGTSMMPAILSMKERGYVRTITEWNVFTRRFTRDKLKRWVGFGGVFICSLLERKFTMGHSSQTRLQ